MKKILYAALLLTSATFICFSCDDFLDKKPLSEITEEALGIDPNAGTEDSVKYKTALQAEQLLQAAYNDFGSEYWQLDWYIINDAQSDNAYAGEPNDVTMQVDEFRLNASNTIVTRDWKYLFSQIAKANSVIEWVPKVPDPELTAQRKNEIVGEASWIRAMCYFNLVRMYGDVPLVLKEIPSINNDNLEEVYPLLYPERSSLDSVYTQIMADLEYALQYAPDYSTFKFRVTKPLVSLLLAEVYATKDGLANTDWNKVKQYSQTVVNNSNYHLMNSYDALFSVSEEPVNGNPPAIDLENEHCAESLFEVDYTSWSALGNWGTYMFYGIDWKKFNTPSQDIYKAFNTAGDEIRKNSAIVFSDVTGKWADKFWPSNYYPYCNKLRSAEKGNIVIFRLAEAILLLAEAENELGNTGEAKSLLNQIRTRAQLPNTTANSQADLRLAIENEHRMEFAFEGKRWFDLLRRGRCIQVMNACSDHQRDISRASLNENRLVWPIPQAERDQNASLTQNTGY